MHVEKGKKILKQDLAKTIKDVSPRIVILERGHILQLNR